MKLPEASGTNTSNATSVSALRGPTPVSAPKARQTDNSGRSDHVQISTVGSALKSLDSQPAHVSRLFELSSAVSSGHYQVDSYAVSDRLIQEHMRPAA